MKLTIQLTPEQEKNIYDQIINNRLGMQISIEPIGNPYKGLRKKTIQFIEALKDKYGYDWISRNDKYVEDLAYQLKIKDIAQILTNYPCEISRKTDDTRQRIEKFRLTQ